MTKVEYDDEFKMLLAEERKKEKKSIIERIKVLKKPTFSDVFIIEFTMLVVSLLLVIIISNVLIALRKPANIVNYYQFGFITVGYVFSLMYVRGLFIKILFSYKGCMMRLYYKRHNSLITNENMDNHVYVPVSDNGRIIGLLESFLYAIGLLLQSLTLIGIVLAVRSYVSVTSQNFKEESEFYIIGLMGSLLSTIVLTGFYILIVLWATDRNILNEIMLYIPSIS